MFQSLIYLHETSLDSPPNVHVSLLLGAQTWAQHSVWDLTSAELRGNDHLSSPVRDTLLNVAWMLLLFLVAGACCCLMFSLSTENPWWFMPDCFPAGQCPVCTGAWDYSFPRAEFSILLFQTSWDSCMPLSPAWWDPLSGSKTILCISHSFQFYICNHAEGYSPIIQVINEDVNQYWP